VLHRWGNGKPWEESEETKTVRRTEADEEASLLDDPPEVETSRDKKQQRKKTDKDFYSFIHVIHRPVCRK
jgi:hypothetical protein